MTLTAPFPYPGGKSRVAREVWARFGDVPNFVEPFFGSGAVLLARPEPWHGTETINDADGLVSNFWRALQADPDAVAHHADWPVNENDLHARHIWLVNNRKGLTERLEGDPDWYDARAAGWWVWGCCCWIGAGWCAGNGPWNTAVNEDGENVITNTGDGVNRKRVHLGNAGQGVKRQLVHLGGGRGVKRQLVHLRDAGQGVNRQLVHLRDAGQGVNRQLVAAGDGDAEHECPECGTGTCGLLCWMKALSRRLERVRVCSGDWSRVCGPTPTFLQGLTGVFLDPPYSADAGRDMGMYAVDCGQVAHDVRAWCEENGDNPLLRIALCGYSGEGHDGLTDRGWTAWEWRATGGYGNQGNGSGRENATREVIWFSPHCLPANQPRLMFDTEEVRA